MCKYASLKSIRSYVCDVTKEAEDPNNWSENDFMKEEVLYILSNCPWYYIYEIIEYFLQKVPYRKDEFVKEINEYFVAKGIGWKLNGGELEARGDEPFEQIINEAVDVLGAVHLDTSQNEIREALHDLSKRPEPDITGSIQHSIAALECLCRKITGDKNTLGTLLKNHPDIVPRPLNDVTDKLFGYASNWGRHLMEGKNPEYAEAELAVHLCAALCTYLGKKSFPTGSNLEEW